MPLKDGDSHLLTPEKAEKLIQDRKGPLSDRDVALKNGCSYWVIRYWLRRGLSPNTPTIYRDFAERWEAAKIARKESLLKVIQDAYEDYKGEDPKKRGDVKAAMWMLERMAPKQFGDFAVKAGHQDGDIDMDELIQEVAREGENLDLLLLDPPNQMLEAMKRCAPQLRDLLDEIAPVLPAGE